MTDREPFAKYEIEETTRDSEIGVLFTVLVAGQVVTIAKQDRASDIVGKINSVHDKSVRESVEEFRERAAKHIRHECMACEGSGRMPGMETECEYCGRPRDAIYALSVDGK